MEVFLHQRKSLLLTLLGQRQNCNAIDNSDRLNIHKYLMVKNNIKWYSGILNKCFLHYWVLEDR